MTNLPSKIRIYTVILILISQVFIGCSKKEPLNESAKVLQYAIPKNVTSFYLLDGHKFKDSNVTIKDISDFISLIDSGDVSKAQDFKKNLLEILSAIPQGKFAELIAGIVAYVSDTEMGLCFQSANSAASTKLIDSLKTLQQKNNFSVLSADKPNRILILLNTQTSDATLEKMSRNSCLTKVSSDYKLSDYLDTELAKPSVFAIGSFNIQKDISITSQAGTVSSNDLPINNFQLIQSLDKTYRLHVQALLEPTSIEQNRLVEALSRPMLADSVGNSFPGVPDRAAFAINMSKTFLDAILVAAIAQSTPEQASMAQSIRASLKTVDTVSVAVLQGDSDAIFPDLAFSFNSNDSENLHETLKTEIQKLVSSQVPMSNWLEKETEGVRFSYVQSPLGVGVYIAKQIDKVFVSSSELGILSIANNKLMQLDNELQARGFITPTTAPLLSLYASAPRLAGLLDSVQSSLSLFTGGQSTFNNEQIAMLRSMSIGTVSISFKDRIMSIDLDFLPKATTEKL